MYACACTHNEAFGAALVMNSRIDFHVALQNYDRLILGDFSELRKNVTQNLTMKSVLKCVVETSREAAPMPE